MTQMIEAWWKRLVIDEKRQKEKYGWEWERERERAKESERGSKNKRSWVEGYMKNKRDKNGMCASKIPYKLLPL